MVSLVRFLEHSGYGYITFLIALLWYHMKGLTNRLSQPLPVVELTFNLMKEFPMFAMLAPASRG
jgi:hypothetical protein